MNFPTAALIPLLLTLAACQSSPHPHSGKPAPGAGHSAAHTVITGQASYRERIAPPPGAVLTVQLVDAQLADTPAAVIASADFPQAKGPPFDFRLPYDPARLRRNSLYTVHASLRDAHGRLWFVTDTAIPVVPSQPAPVQLLLSRSTPMAPPAPWATDQAHDVFFRAAGNEPGWWVEVTTGKTPALSAELDYGQNRLHLERTRFSKDRWLGKHSDGRKVELQIQHQSCQDSMSGETFPASATLTVGNKTYRGCGRFLSK